MPMISPVPMVFIPNTGKVKGLFTSDVYNLLGLLVSRLVNVSWDSSKFSSSIHVSDLNEPK